MRYCGLILSYGLVPYLPRAIKSLQGVPVYVLNPTKSWWSDDMVDKTIDMIEGLDVTYLSADLANETEARNYAKEFCKSHGFDVMIMLDSDEVLDDIDKLIEWVDNKEAPAYCAEIVDYYPDEDTALPKRGHCPIVAIRTANDHQFYDKRCYNGEWIVNNKILIHHYSFLIPEQDYKKASKLYDDAWPPVEYRNIIK
jgi:hypothetical protein